MTREGVLGDVSFVLGDVLKIFDSISGYYVEVKWPGKVYGSQDNAWRHDT